MNKDFVIPGDRVVAAPELTALEEQRPFPALQRAGALVLEVDAGQRALEGLVDQPSELEGGGLEIESAWADVGDAVARGVGQAGPGREGEIGAKRIRRGQAGPFADQHQRHARTERMGRLVAERDTGLRGDDDRRERQPLPLQTRQQRRDEGGGVLVDRGRGQTVGDDDGEIAGAAPRRQHAPALLREATAEIGPAQIIAARAGSALGHHGV